MSNASMTRAYSCVLHLYPAHIRAIYGAEMRESFESRPSDLSVVRPPNVGKREWFYRETEERDRGF